MYLNPSRSRNGTAAWHWWRCARRSPLPIRSFRSIRFGNPVRKSCCAESVKSFQCLRRAHIAKHDDRSGHVSCTVTDGSNGVFNVDLMPVTADKNTVQRQASRLVLRSRLCHQIQDCPPRTCVYNANTLCHFLSGRVLPAPARIRSATGFKNVIVPNVSVQITASPMQSTVNCACSFSKGLIRSMILRWDALRRARFNSPVSAWPLI